MNLSKVMAAALVLCALAAPALAIDYTSVQDGNWGVSTTWSPAGVPGQGDNVNIAHRVVLEANYSVDNLTIASGGKFVISGAFSVMVYGNWTNNGSDSLVNGFVFLRGPGNRTIGGSNPTSFWRLNIRKSSTSDTVYLTQNISARYPGSGTFMVDTGNFVTNGRNLDVSVTNARVDGMIAGRFWVTGASTVNIYWLYQWGLGYFYVTSPSAVVNIFRQDIANSQHRMDILDGTVNYTGTGTNLNLQLYTNNNGWGWFATGGTITFNGSIASQNLSTHFRATGTSVVRFAGSASSSVLVHNWTGAAQNSWWIEDLRVEKTGGAALRFYTSATAVESLFRVNSAFTVNPGAVVNFTGSFQAGRGYRLPTLTNNGTVNDSAPVFISGDLTGSGTFASGPGGAVTFDGTGTSSVNQPASFWDLTMNKTGGGSLAIFRDLPVGRNFRAQAGTFALGRRTLTLGTASSAGSVAVASGATFTAIGSADSSSIVTAVDEAYPYAFTVDAGATIGARHARFLYPDTMGVNIAGTVDPANDFDSSAFVHGGIPGRMLKIENDQTLDGLDHVAFSGTAGYNIEKLGNSGHITVTLGGGTRWGEAYDNDPNNRIDWVGPDAGVLAVLAPVGTIPLGTVISPRLRLKNFGQYAADFAATVVITDSLGAVVFDTTETGIILAAGDSTDRTFTAAWTADPRGPYTVTGFVTDGLPENDTAVAAVRVVGRDVGISGILSPAGAVPPNSVVTPTVRVTNFGLADAVTDVQLWIVDASSNTVYDTTETGVAVAAGATVQHAFTRTWLAAPEGRYRVIACTKLADDINPANDTGATSFAVGTAVPTAWTEIAQVPLTPSGKAVKDGGMIAYDAGLGAHYVLKGNKTSDFYSFDGTNWVTLAAMPLGTENKNPNKGANICTDGSGTVYATKGNNTVGFWKYATDSTGGVWTQLADVPLGVSNKRVKGGTDLVYVQQDTAAYVYLLKGDKTEFYRYNVGTGEWQTLADAPAGAKAKWDKGSWLVYDEAARKLYAHKAKYSELYAYDIDSLTWGPLQAGIPLTNQQTGKRKKAKDGSDAALAGGLLYALKGGNTVEFYAWNPGTGEWSERALMPEIGSTAKKKRVKGGGGLTTDGSYLYALKGNKTAEVWMYDPGAVALAQPARSGVMAGPAVRPAGMSLGPNPLLTGTAVLRYSLPGSGPAMVRVYDVTGRSVLSRSFVAGRAGTLSLDLKGLAAGVYLVKLTAGDFAASQKLVVER